MATVATVDYDGEDFIVNCEFFDNARAKGAPTSIFDKTMGHWILPHTSANAKYINDSYKDREIGITARAAMLEFLHKKEKQADKDFPAHFKFKTQPRPYQMDALNKAYGMDEFAFIMEMRTGKSFVDINLTSQYFLEGKIKNWLIVTFPGAIKSTWNLQLKEHCPIPYNAKLMQSGAKKKLEDWIDTPYDELKVLIVGIESLSNGSGPQLIERFASSADTKFTIDESTCIKNPKAKTKSKRRTRSSLCWDVGGISKIRTILTGTPITQGVEDLYSQYRFLNWQILGFKSYFAFRNRHCIMGGFEGRKIIGFVGVDKIVAKIAPYSYQITTKEAIGLPKEITDTVMVEPSTEQHRLLKELGNPYDMCTSIGDKELEVETILERMIRYQQIVGGHFPWNENKETRIEPLSTNPKLDALTGIIETIPISEKIIIWARFIPEVEAIAELFPDSITFIGGMTDEYREKAQVEFMKPDGPRFWIATQQASARGIELASASVHIFYSNSFSYDERKQASMRTNSSHQKSDSILYIDICMNHKIDRHIIEVLRNKQNVAEYIQKAIGDEQ